MSASVSQDQLLLPLPALLTGNATLVYFLDEGGNRGRRTCCMFPPRIRHAYVGFPLTRTWRISPQSCLSSYKAWHAASTSVHRRGNFLASGIFSEIPSIAFATWLFFSHNVQQNEVIGLASSTNNTYFQFKTKTLAMLTKEICQRSSNHKTITKHDTQDQKYHTNHTLGFVILMRKIHITAHIKNGLHFNENITAHEKGGIEYIWE